MGGGISGSVLPSFVHTCCLGRSLSQLFISSTSGVVDSPRKKRDDIRTRSNKKNPRDLAIPSGELEVHFSFFRRRCTNPPFLPPPPPFFTRLTRLRLPLPLNALLLHSAQERKRRLSPLWRTKAGTRQQRWKKRKKKEARPKFLRKKGSLLPSTSDLMGSPVVGPFTRRRRSSGQNEREVRVI